MGLSEYCSASRVDLYAGIQRRAWVGAALDSALRQTYTEFELIVADNASTDGTLEIVRSFDDSRVCIQTATRTVGAVANR
jgi:glycosyltransferase involved in cell wall biosynthesis